MFFELCFYCTFLQTEKCVHIFVIFAQFLSCSVLGAVLCWFFFNLFWVIKLQDFKNLSNKVILCNQWTAISNCWGKTVVVRFSGCFWEIMLISDWRSNFVVLGSFSCFHASFNWKAELWNLSFECCLNFVFSWLTPDSISGKLSTK